MHRKRFTIAIFILVSIILYTYAQQDPWGNEESIKSLTPEQIINEPQKAREHWQTLTTEQREAVYQDSRGIKEFSDKFAAEKGLKALDLRLGNAYYDGTNLVNGNTRISVSDLKNAEVIALDGGGFRIKFPNGSDLTVSDSSGADFDEFFYIGGLDVYGPSHYRMEPNSKRLDVNVEIITSDYPVSLYYGPQDISEEDNIQFDNKKMSIAGQGIHVRFTDGNKFEEVVVDGKVTIENGGVTIEFDGEGNAEEFLPIGEPETPLTIEDENAPDKEYVLDPGDKAIEDDGTLEGFGGCGMAQTGFAILDVTGRGTREICKGPLVQTGTAFVDKMYEAKLFINEEQLKKVRDEFISKFGREPNFNDKNDLQEFSTIVNEQVTDMKLRQTMFQDVSSSPRRLWNVLVEAFNRARLSSTTFSESVDITTKIIPLAVSIKQGDTVEYQVSGNEGLITVNRKDGTTKEISVSGRLVRAMIQNFYDENIAYVKGQSKDLLSNALAITPVLKK